MIYLYNACVNRHTKPFYVLLHGHVKKNEQTKQRGSERVCILCFFFFFCKTREKAESKHLSFSFHLSMHKETRKDTWTVWPSFWRQWQEAVWVQDNFGSCIFTFPFIPLIFTFNFWSMQISYLIKNIKFNLNWKIKLMHLAVSELSIFFWDSYSSETFKQTDTFWTYCVTLRNKLS